METDMATRKNIIRIVLLLVVAVGVFVLLRRAGFLGGESGKKNEKGTEMKKSDVTPVAGPPTIIYKTKADYAKLVPVGVSQDKKSIVSYPNMTDMLPNNYPKKLNKGYLFGNVSVNSGFLKLTMEEYAALKELPSPEKLFGMLVDSDPFLEIYDCGSRSEFGELEKELNQIIDSGKLSSRCNKIK
jgi:hypothetical protein